MAGATRDELEELQQRIRTAWLAQGGDVDAYYPYYDVALVCRNGHATNSFAGSRPFFNSLFCADCGDATLFCCTHCETPLLGSRVEPMFPERAPGRSLDPP